jgi:hypothetical protein
MFAYTLFSSLLWFQLFCSLFPTLVPLDAGNLLCPELDTDSLAMRAQTVAMELRVDCKVGRSINNFIFLDCFLLSHFVFAYFPFLWDGFASDRRCASVVQIFCSAVLGESRLHLYHGFNYQLQYVQLCFL